ncbi:adenosine deaminase [Ferrimonas marina]|uniref:Adenosine deaminase n=1 Tax=Ferrimonas marina TaxID=299255 RepID=A0A1M5QVL3_9GAMM|nr:adenosine deaminase [Ferrimonas marina]SHH18217.1 adenosine deaminase [Ferrimonas marina]
MIDATLPLVDLHRHLDGNVRAQTILELARRHNVALPAADLVGLTPHVQITGNEPDLMQFLAKLDWGIKVLGDLDAVNRVAYENMEDLARAGIDYAELRFSPHYMAMSHGLPMEGVIEAVIDGVERGQRNLPVKANLIGILSRTFGVEACQRELEACLAFRQRLVALDLAGDELGQPGHLFESHFAQARDAGLQITVHAGEAGGAQNVWHAIEALGAQRIGHGVKAIEDPSLLEYMAKHRIVVESCLTSNLQTSTVASLDQHPVKAFLEAGVLATLNTDDPAVEGIELGYEYQVQAPKAGLSAEQIRQLQRNGVEAAFLSSSERKALLTSKQG